MEGNLDARANNGQKRKGKRKQIRLINKIKSIGFAGNAEQIIILIIIKNQRKENNKTKGKK